MVQRSVDMYNIKVAGKKVVKIVTCRQLAVTGPSSARSANRVILRSLEPSSFVALVGQLFGALGKTWKHTGWLIVDKLLAKEQIRTKKRLCWSTTSQARPDFPTKLE